MTGEGTEPHRIEADMLGEVAVPRNRLWGAETQRCFLNFR